MVVEATTRLEPHDLLRCVKGIERDLGRLSGMRWGPRPIDLDIILYGDRQVETEDLQIPHIRFHERQFVLRPLSDLVPDLVAPGQTSTIQQLADSAAIGEVLSHLGPLQEYPDQP
jgi:7,8-dihydro-6-hydroxymethylpterin-pyrophosphokinase